MNNPSVTNDYVPPEYLIKSDDTSIYSMPPTYISNIVTFRHKSFRPRYSFSISYQHSSTDSTQTLCLLAFDGSADSVLISDDKRFVSTGF